MGTGALLQLEHSSGGGGGGQNWSENKRTNDSFNSPSFVAFSKKKGHRPNEILLPANFIKKTPQRDRFRILLHYFLLTRNTEYEYAGQLREVPPPQPPVVATPVLVNGGQ